MIKAELRKKFISLQTDLSAEHRMEKSGKIAARFFESFDLTRVRYLHCFIPIEKFKEIDTRIIFTTLWNEFPGIHTVVPRVDFQSHEIVNLIFNSTTSLHKNMWDIEEPLHDEIVDAQKIDIVLVPGVCFDSQGHRVGYGKGFYDRFLVSCRPDCLKIGLSYFEPVEKIDDVHDGDVRLDFVVTPSEVVRGAGNERLSSGS